MRSLLFISTVSNRVKQVEGRKLIKDDEDVTFSCPLESSFTKLPVGGESDPLEVDQNASPKLKSFHSESTKACGQTSEALAIVKKDEPLQVNVIVTAEKTLVKPSLTLDKTDLISIPENMKYMAPRAGLEPATQ